MNTEVLRPRMLAAGALAAFAFLLLGCASRPGRETEKVNPVSDTPPKVEAMERPATVLRNTFVPSKGDCAPRYANGQTGTCIENKPCRGLGMLDEQDKPVCSCFGKTGGCDTGFRCDGLKKRCVAEGEPTRERVPARSP